MIDKCYKKAKHVMEVCSTKHGLYASGSVHGYNAIWARDSMISLTGAPCYKNVFKQSLLTLAENQSKNGQIPNAVDIWSERKAHVDYASIDSSLWYIIGHFIYKKKYGKALMKKTIDKALNWLACQDVGEDGTLLQLPTSDWQDAFPHRYGRTINTQALYYYVLKLVGKPSAAKKLKSVIDKDEDRKLWNGMFYVPYRWKNHNKYKEIGDWFDSFGNLLAIVFGLADNAKGRKILAYIGKKRINKPYPVRVISPPIRKGSKYWQDYFNDCDARHPFHYSNGGIWPFIGSYYVLALIKMKKFVKAEQELKKLAESNLKGNFPEWIDPITKRTHGCLQAWDAGTYILAYDSLKKKKVLI